MKEVDEIDNVFVYVRTYTCARACVFRGEGRREIKREKIINFIRVIKIRFSSKKNTII